MPKWDFLPSPVLNPSALNHGHETLTLPCDRIRGQWRAQLVQWKHVASIQKTGTTSIGRKYSLIKPRTTKMSRFCCTGAYTGQKFIFRVVVLINIILKVRIHTTQLGRTVPQQAPQRSCHHLITCHEFVKITFHCQNGTISTPITQLTNTPP